MERIIFKRIYNFLSANNLLYKYQSGFVPGHSTTHHYLFICLFIHLFIYLSFYILIHSNIVDINICNCCCHVDYCKYVVGGGL